MLGFYLIGSDEGRIPSDVCLEALVTAATEWRQQNQDIKIRLNLLHGNIDTKTIELLGDNGIDVLPTETDVSTLRAVAVGALWTLKRGGDRANIALHKVITNLESLTTSQHGDRGVVGRVYNVLLQNPFGALQNVFMVVNPSFNKTRAGHIASLPECRSMLVGTYVAMLNAFQGLDTRESSSSHCEQADEPMRKRVRTEEHLCPIPSTISPIGLGTLPFGVCYPDRRLRPSVANIESMVARCTEVLGPLQRLLLDVADTYCEGPNDFHYIERVLGEIFKKRGEGFVSKIAIATKCGMNRISSESTGWRTRFDLNGDYIRKSIETSMAALGQKKLFLWQLHHGEHIFKRNKVQLDSLLETAFNLQREGKLENVGLCNVTPEMLNAYKSFGLYSIENEFNFWTRSAEFNGIVDMCREYKIVFIVHSPFGGLKTRRGERNFLTAFPACVSVAKRQDVDPAQVYLRYLLHRLERKGVCVIVIPSARDPNHIFSISNAEKLVITSDNLNCLDDAWETKGRKRM